METNDKGRRSAAAAIRTAAGTTVDQRALDVRHMQRTGCLTPERYFAWNWQRAGETVASIQVRTQVDRSTLDYRHKTSGGDGVPVNCPVFREWTACNLGGDREALWPDDAVDRWPGA